MLLRDLVQRQPPQSVALRAPSRTPLTYSQLASLIERTAESLVGSGFGTSDIIASAANIVRTLHLNSEDCCLNVMPLFHIHGLVAAVLASIASGGSVFCTPGFNAFKFLAGMEEARPSWYTAVPTMHRAILARAPRNVGIIEANPLRLIRSSSASLPAPVLGELEAPFSCPVIEAYSMTEAAHQMTSNQLPPGKRKPGTVGVAADPEVRLMNERGELLSVDQIGEVVIRRPNVTRGYEGNPQANEESLPMAGSIRATTV